MITFDIRYFETLGSTQDEARRQMQAGAPHGTVVASREQTSGRGRQGRQWISPPGNLYLSILLRLDLPPPRLAELGFVAALAVADTVDRFLPGRATLKWPNDVLVNGAKIAGILIEQAEQAAIIGIGFNVSCPSPCGKRTGRAKPEQHYPITSLAYAGATRPNVDAARAAFLVVFSQRLETWLTNGFAPIRADWLTRAHPLGTSLRIQGDNETIAGRFAGLADDGTLLLNTPQGLRRVITGDVAIEIR